MHEASHTAVAMSEAEREQVRAQLNRILETHHFKNSRRYPALLRFIVEETLEGRGEYLKERLLGVRVFDRPSDYDTASDPIVRVTIAEIRKRIAQYYHDEEHDAEIRIELLPGRYEPEFRARTSHREASPDRVAPPITVGYHEPPAVASPLHTAPSALPLARSRFTRTTWLLTLGTLAVLILTFASLLPGFTHRSALDQMWNPLLNSQGSILFCVPTDVGRISGPAIDLSAIQQPGLERPDTHRSEVPTFLAYESLGENVVYSDMLATLRIANVFAVNRHPYRVRLNVSTTLEDLRQGPTILVGGLDNQWTIRAMSNLRFRFAGSDDERYWIADQKNPANKEWSVQIKQDWSKVTRDYAVVARVHNEQTGQIEVIVAGIGMSGTAAAGEFLADPARMEELRNRLGDGFGDHDFEAVLSTDVVNGIAGSAKIMAVASW